jgi:hypothetical protein
MVVTKPRQKESRVITGKPKNKKKRGQTQGKIISQTESTLIRIIIPITPIITIIG